MLRRTSHSAFAIVCRHLIALSITMSSMVIAQDGVLTPVVPPVINDANCDSITSIVPTCLHSRTAPSNAIEMMETDVRVCNCIDKTAGNVMNLVQEPQISEEERRRLLTQRKILDANARAGNLSVLQSSSFQTNPTEAQKNLLVFGAGEIRGELRKNAAEVGARPDNEPTTSSEISKIGLIPPENASWQCVTFQEYNAQRSIPTDNRFYKMLSRTSSAADWNETALRERFDSAQGEEKDFIEQRLIFLSRNPIYRAIFKASPSERFPQELITRRQNELLTVIRNLAPAEGSNCFETPNACWREVNSGDRMKEYRQAISAFMANDDVIDLVSAQNTADYMAELRRLSNSGTEISDSVPTTPDGYFIQTQNRMPELRQCAGTSAEASCYTLFRSHCKNIRQIDARVKSGLRQTSNDLNGLLLQEEVMHASFDLENNPGFRAFNDMICSQPFANAAGEALNFFQYQARLCGGTNRPAVCQDRQKLLRQFLLEHNSGGDDAVANLRAGFSELVESNEFVAVTEAQVLIANNVAESPAQLRERFGGSYPLITPEGLVPNPQATKTLPTVASKAADTVVPTSTGDNDVVTSGTREVGVTTNIFSGDNRVPYLPGSSSQFNVDPKNGQDVVSPFQNRVTPYLPQLLSTVPTLQTNDQMVLPAEEPVVTARTEERGTGSIIATASRNSGAISGTRNVNKGNTARASGGGGGGSVTTSGPSFVAGNQKEQKRSTNLNFKYGLNRDGTVMRNDVEIVPVVDQPVVATVSTADLTVARTNPAALVLSSEQMDQIKANPNPEVPVLIQAGSGGPITVYARKDANGNITFSAQPSAGRMPASEGSRMRVDVTDIAYAEIQRNPDDYFNGVEELVRQVADREASDGLPMILEVTSQGRASMRFEVTKKDDLLYHFKLKR